MERIPIPKGVNTETENLLNNIMDTVLGSPIILDTAPTAAIPLLTEGQIGKNGSILYWVINGTLYSIALTVVA